MNERLLSPLLPDLHLLTVLDDTRSYTQAAKRLGISKASASARITSLEKITGVPLVSRSSRSVALTEAGRRLVEDIRPAFVRIEDGFSSTRDVASQPRGLLRVSAPVAIGRQLVMPRLPAFLTMYPEVRLELDLSDRLVNLQQEGFDVAVRHTQSPPETHVAWKLCETRTWLVASPAYVKRHGAPAHPTELARHNCLPYLRGGGIQRWSFERSLKRKKIERIDIPIAGTFKANNSELLREAVVAGLGIGLLPDFSCSDVMRQGLVVSLMDPWRSVGFFGQAIYAIRPYVGCMQVPRAVHCFVEHLRTHLASAARAD